MFEQITVNLYGRVREETLFGRKFYVAPGRMIVEGVLHGNKGKLYYPKDEISRNPGRWNGVPIVNGHPQVNGKYISARDPEILDKYSMGQVFRSTTANGPLDAEAWFDAELTKRVNPTVASALEAGKLIELSTGLFTEDEPTKGVFNGNAYDFIARNHDPDHLAVLIDGKGACSIADGCGINVNSEGSETLDKMIEKGIVNYLKEKKIVINSDTQQGSSNTEKEESNVGKLNDTDKKTIVDGLITNCSCKGKPVWTEADRPALNAMPDDRLTALDENRKHAISVNEALKKPLEINGSKVTFNSEKMAYEAVVNEPVKPQPVDIGGKKFILNDKGGYDPVPETKEPDKVTAKTPLTENEWLANAPPRIRNTLVQAAKIAGQQNARHIKQIMGNPNNKYTLEQLTLKANESPEELEMLASLAGNRNVTGNDDSDEDILNVNTYLGAAGGPSTNRSKFDPTEEVLEPPTINWAEQSKKTA